MTNSLKENFGNSAPELVTIASRLKEFSLRFEGINQELYSKLIRISNQREPKQKEESPVELKPESFVEEMRFIISKSEETLRKLEDNLSHLNNLI